MPGEIILGSLRYRFGPVSADIQEFMISEGFVNCGDIVPSLINAGVCSVSEIPLASWFLARLAYLTCGSVGLEQEVQVDGVDIELHVVVSRLAVDWVSEAAQNGQGLLFDVGEFSPPPRNDTELAVLSFTFGNDEFDAFAVRLTECDLNEICEKLCDALLAAPNKLERCRVSMFDHDWLEDPDGYEPTPNETSRNEYGWDGKELLGKNNIKFQRP